MLGLIVAAVAALLVFVALERTDDSHFQVGVPPLVVVLLFTIVPAPDRVAAGLGAVVGALAYAAFFVRQRGRRVPMPDYERGESEPTIDSPVRGPAPRADRRTEGAPDGPYYKPGTPHTAQVSATDTPGEPMLFHGHVLDRDGQPQEGVAIEIWHANGEGDYDLDGYVCRGHQYTDPRGRFAFRTVKPFGYGIASWSMAGVVDYRSAHIHVKLRRPGEDTFTTQVWFADDPRKARDVAYSRFAETNTVELDSDEATGFVTARYDFVI